MELSPIPRGSGRRVALVTGASSGIGAALAGELARRGYDLVLNGRDEARLEAVAATGRAAGARVLARAGDLARPGEGGRLADDARAWAGGAPALVVINAGFGIYGEFAGTPLEQEIDLVRLQAIAPMELLKPLLPELVRRGEGAILAVASVYSYSPVPHQSVYGACKAFQLSFFEALAEELRGTGVGVTVVCPGVTRTRFRARAGVKEKDPSSGMSADEVARRALRAVDRRRRVLVPGPANRIFVALARHLPRSWLHALLGRVNRARGVSPAVAGAR